jgi:hypothetical protein
VCLPVGDFVGADWTGLAEDAFELLGEEADDDDAEAKKGDAGGTSEEDEDDGGGDEDGLGLREG